MTDEPTELIKTLESIREKEFPHVPHNLVREIVNIEHDTLEDRKTSQEKISDTVENHLDEIN